MRTIWRGVKLFLKQLLTTSAKFLAFGLVLVLVVAMLAAIGNEETSVLPEKLETKHFYGTENAKDKILVLPIRGVILTDKDADPLSSLFDMQVTYGYSVKETLRLAALDDEVKGVLLLIDSPGGTVVGAKAISDGMVAYKLKTGKPVYAYVGGLAASGSYWAAAGADKIIADTGTTIGSIGVIFGPFKYYKGVTAEDGGAFVGGVITQKGIDTTFITAGKSKDLGNPYRQLTETEIATLQVGVNDAYGEFVKHVSAGRKLEPTVIREQIGAMVFSEQQAGQLGLIDAVGNREAAITAVAQAANIDGREYEVVVPKASGGFLANLLEASNRWVQPNRVSVTGCPFNSLVMAYHGPVTGLCN